MLNKFLKARWYCDIAYENNMQVNGQDEMRKHNKNISEYLL